jgi:hypothetical protein
MSATCRATAIASYHEDLPTYAPAWGAPESRFGYYRAFWTDGRSLRPADYFGPGCRVGQRVGNVAFEQGLAATAFTNSLLLGAGAGVSLVRPALAVRFTWTPASLAGYVNPDRVEASFQPSRWWQVTALAEAAYRPHGFGWSAGARATKQGLGPLLAAESGSGVLSLRGELSATVPAPWADTTTRGTLISLGIGTSLHGREPH